MTSFPVEDKPEASVQVFCCTQATHSEM